LSRESRAFGPCGVPTSLAHNSGRGQPLFWGGSETGQHARRALREPPQRGIVLTEGDSHARGKDMGAVPMGAHRNPPSGPPLCYERPHPPFRVPLGLWGPGAARCVLAGAWARGPLSAPVQGVRAVWAHPGPSPTKPTTLHATSPSRTIRSTCGTTTLPGARARRVCTRPTGRRVGRSGIYVVSREKWSGADCGLNP
jgi:hypothetical protein